ncbi:MAG: F0F1 ATP synthase subunit B [bacterium]|jgi:F-type H+-transporting ATPase subunit b
MVELNRTLLFQILNFLVLMAFLYLFLFKPISRFLAQRSASLQRTLDDAKDSRAEAERKLSEYNDLLSQAQKKIEAMRNVAEREALEHSRQTIKEAKEEAKQLIDRAKEEIEEAMDEARRDLRREVVGLTTTLAEKVIKRSLKEEDQARFIQDSLEQLKEKG